jgi:type IV secretion system protein VirB9
MSLRHVAAAGLLAISATPAFAQVRPQPGAGDAHIQSIDYNADQVVMLETAPGYQLTVGLAADEQVQSVAVGDSADWQVSAGHNGDHLFVKALQGGVSTNMTVVTSTRTYVFDLVALSAPSPTMAYTVQFHYAPPAEGPQQANDQSPSADTDIAAAAPEGRYVLHGDPALRPAAITDDGAHTYIEWPPGVALPATYIHDANGVETLANGEMRGGLYVVDSVHRQLIFRIDKHSARADRVVPRQTR